MKQKRKQKIHKVLQAFDQLAGLDVSVDEDAIGQVTGDEHTSVAQQASEIQASEGQGDLDGDNETIADELNLSQEAIALIDMQERVARDVLALFDINYDELISLENQSPYALAIQANPQVLDYIKRSERPVTDALKVALEFKPYAEFVAKYGSRPEDIKSAIRQELEAEQTSLEQASSGGNTSDLTKSEQGSGQSKNAQTELKIHDDEILTPFSNLQRQKRKTSGKKSSDVNKFVGSDLEKMFAR